MFFLNTHDIFYVFSCCQKEIQQKESRDLPVFVVQLFEPQTPGSMCLPRPAGGSGFSRGVGWELMGLDGGKTTFFLCYFGIFARDM